jgi:tetratricopeptide (TPR) repeat protein
MALDQNLESLSNLASHLLQIGPVSKAIDAHERLLAVNPNLPDSWYNLGYLQQQAGLFEAALRSYRLALEHGVNRPEEVHVNCAVILAEHMRSTAQAVSEFEVALQLNPRYVPALVNLGNIHEQRGDREQALGAYEHVLSIEPDNALALSRLPNLKLVIKADDPLINRLERAIKRSGTTAAERADLGFGLGKALDSAAEYDRAFAAYTNANQASRLSAGSRGIYDAEAHERLVDRLIAAFPEPYHATEQNDDPLKPIFICGMFRSGSTLIEQVLASHSLVTGGGELDLLPVMARDHLMPLMRESSGSIESSKLQPLRGAYLKKVAARFADAKIVTDKRPDNFLNIGLIKLLFPEAKIVHTRRHAVDNCLSVFFLHLSHSMPYALDLLDIAHWYRQYERLMSHWKMLYGEDIHDVDYDELVNDFEPTIRRLLGYCQLPWDDACLAFHKTQTLVMTPSAWQVRQPLYTRSSGRWRNYEHFLVGLRRALGERQLA